MMRRKFGSLVWLLLLYLCSSSVVNGQNPGWFIGLTQVKPLESTKTDVERVFDLPKVRRSFIEHGVEHVLYEHSEGKFSVQYSTGKCPDVRASKDSASVISDSSFRVDKDVVVRIIFFPKTKVKFSNFQVDKRRLVKTSDGHDPAWHYVDPQFGVEYGVQRGRVIYVLFEPSTRFENVRCGTPKT